MPIKQYKTRKDVPDKYKWDLEAMLQGKTPEQVMKKYESLFSELIEMKDSKFESKEAFLKALKKEDELTKVAYVIQNWLQNKLNENVVEASSNAAIQEFMFRNYNLEQKMGPEEPRIFANQSKIEKYLKEKEFEPYRSTFKEIFETKKHQLPKAIQEFRVAESRADVQPREVFSILTDAEIDYGFATTSKGKKIKITRANRIALREHPDKQVRKSSAISVQKAYLEHKESLSNLLFQQFKKNATWAKLEKFDNVIEKLVFPDRSSEKLVLSLYEAVEKKKHLKGEFRSAWTKVYKATQKENPTKYDFGLPLVNVKTDYSIEEMQKVIINALKPLGKEYTDTIKRAFDERWIDYLPTKGKRSGAYSIQGTYPLDKKYILMNNDGSIGAMETLAHELGHSMHSYFSDKHNHIREASYKIFVAEIASIFNENMLTDYLLETSKDDKLKFQIRQKMAERFEGTVFRQTQWSNFEYDLYKAVEAGKPVSTYKQIAEIYYKSEQKYSAKPSKKYVEDDQYYSVIVPHFYFGFYVYRYSIGQLVANIFFQRYKTHGVKALEDYVNKFLAAGSRMTPLEVLKANGIDLEDPKTYEEAFAPAFENVREFKKLSKKLFKI